MCCAYQYAHRPWIQCGKKKTVKKFFRKKNNNMKISVLTNTMTGLTSIEIKLHTNAIHYILGYQFIC